MKIIRTKNGNALIASNIIFITKEVDFSVNDKKNVSINAFDVRGQGYCLAECQIDSDADAKFESILTYLTQEGD